MKALIPLVPISGVVTAKTIYVSALSAFVINIFPPFRI
jgi:hypothetical protein